MSKSALLIAFHFPPVAGSSGLQRTLALAKYLPDCNYLPIVLSAKAHAYERSNPDSLASLPPDLIVSRAFALDTARHLSIHGKYLDALARPDRWRSWWSFAVLEGLRLIRKHRPSVLWSTYPIATAHAIGYTLHRLSGVPWVADFRDSMMDDDYPVDPKVRKAHQRIEVRTVEKAQRIVFTAESAKRMYAERYPQFDDSKWQVILNGYDEDAFRDAETMPAPERTPGKFLLLHAGVIYPKERDPRPLFEAIATLHNAGEISADNFELRLRATGHDGQYQPLLEKHGIHQLVSLSPPLPYRDTLNEMLSSSSLLLMQSESCNHQIPAKVYEYFRAKRPILALTHTDGDTAGILRNTGYDNIVPLDDVQAIANALRALLQSSNNVAQTMSNAQIEHFSRESQARATAALFDSLVQ